MKLLAGMGVVFAIGCGSVSGTKVDANGGSGDATGGVTHTLTVTKTGNGMGTVMGTGINCGTDCAESIAEGHAVTLTPMPDSNSVFVKWTGACTGTGACDVTLTADMTVNAQFSAGQVLNFPIAGDSHVSVNVGVFNMDGDYVRGTRATSGLAQATTARIHLVLENNTLTGAACSGTQKTQDVHASLVHTGGPSSTILGAMAITSGQTSIDAEFNFAAVQGPSFDIEYNTNASVAQGCGGSGYSNTGSTITLINQ